VDERFRHGRSRTLLSVALAAAWTTLTASCVDLTVPLDDAGSGQPTMINPTPDSGAKPGVVDAARDPDPMKNRARALKTSWAPLVPVGHCRAHRG
jgi:hypothetical protein